MFFQDAADSEELWEEALRCGKAFVSSEIYPYYTETFGKPISEVWTRSVPSSSVSLDWNILWPSWWHRSLQPRRRAHRAM